MFTDNLNIQTTAFNVTNDRQDNSINIDSRDKRALKQADKFGTLSIKRGCHYDENSFNDISHIIGHISMMQLFFYNFGF